MAERAAELGEIGAGIQITPNALSVLAWLGVAEQVTEQAATPEAIEIRGRHGGRIVAMALGRRFRRRHGLPYLTIHRADLQRVLAEAARAERLIEILPGHEVVEFAIHPHGLTVMADNRERHVELAADVLIGADGVNSFVRSVMPGAGQKRPTGRSAWRALVPADRLPTKVRRDRIGLWLGPSGHVVHYPVRGGAEFNVVAVTDSAPSRPGEAAGPTTRFEGWAAPVRDLLDAGRDWLEWPIAVVKPGGKWAEGPVALLGDAAHAMAPYLAQGAAMAMEDAAVLAQTLAVAKDDVAAALARYQAERRRRVGRVWRAARGAADLYHMGTITGSVRNVVMAVMGGSGLALRYDWIYRWRPPQKKAPPEGGASSAQGGIEAD